MPVPLLSSHWVPVACLVALLRLRVVGHYYQVMTFVIALMEGRVKVQLLLVMVDSQSTHTFRSSTDYLPYKQRKGKSKSKGTLRARARNGTGTHTHEKKLVTKAKQRSWLLNSEEKNRPIRFLLHSSNGNAQRCQYRT